MDLPKTIKTLAALGILVGIVFYSSTFIIDETQNAIKIQLGDPTSVYTKPGLYFKIPFITRINRVDNRLLTYDSQPKTIYTKDKKAMHVDNYAKWRVENTLMFYETVRDIRGAQARLDDIIYSQLREVLGKHTLSEIVSGQTQAMHALTPEELKAVGQEEVSRRKVILDEITENSRKAAKGLGIDIVDVRIKRADLVEENSKAVFGRMDAERRREARGYRSEGEEEALKIISDADRQSKEILAQAEKESEEIRGKADAIATRIYAEAYSLDADFFRFQRSHDAYRKVFDEQTTILLSTERNFFKELK